MTAESMRRMKRSRIRRSRSLALALDTTESAVRDRRVSQSGEARLHAGGYVRSPSSSRSRPLYSSGPADLRVEPTRGCESGHPRQRAEPDWPGHRVRLLLLSRGLRAEMGDIAGC